MRLPATVAALAALLFLRPSLAEAEGQKLVVVELFTSQSCSSCPPADALLTEIARSGEQAGILPLAFHVTYWDRLGWRDRFSLPEATERQRRYTASLGLNTLYTPQAVVQGRHDAVGSDRRAVLRAIAAAREAAASGPEMALSPRAEGLSLSIGGGRGGGTLWLVGFDREHVTPVRGGENSGRRLVESQVVRSLSQAGSWRGEAVRLDLPRPAAGERAAVLLQAPDGAILGAALLPAPAAAGS